MIVAGVDGTGAYSNATYARDMANSYVNQVVRRANSPGNAKQYLRGPGLDGFATGGLGTQTAQFVKTAIQCVTDTRVCLTGYSRGGAAVIDAAQKLNAAGPGRVTVDYLILFDAVDRSLTVDAALIPNNVRNVFHLRRDPKVSSRETFGNCGTKFGAATSYTEKYFYCTHGGVGGCPWARQAGFPGNMNEIVNEGGIDGKTTVTYAQDLQGAQAAWAWIEPVLISAGIIR